MQNDEVIWQIIRHRHCSFMTKIETGIFCRNPYSLTGVCNRSSCPLANSRYATIRDHDGVFYLYMKTIERAHQPTKLWERVKLPLNYDKALEIIDKHLMYWPKLLVHKTKQRLTKMYQMRIRMRKLALKRREKIMTTPRKDIKREARRAEKAEQAAAVERVIEKELLERLKGGTYKDDVNGPIYNYYTEKFVKLLEKIDEPVLEEDNDVVYVEDNLEEEDDMEDFSALDLNASNDDNDDDDDDDEGDAGTDEDDEVTVAIDNKRSRKQSGYGLRKSNKDESSTKLKKKPRVLVEIEHDDTDERQKATH